MPLFLGYGYEESAQSTKINNHLCLVPEGKAAEKAMRCKTVGAVTVPQLKIKFQSAIIKLGGGVQEARQRVWPAILVAKIRVINHMMRLLYVRGPVLFNHPPFRVR